MALDPSKHKAKEKRDQKYSAHSTMPAACGNNYRNNKAGLLLVLTISCNRIIKKKPAFRLHLNLHPDMELQKK